MVDPGRLRRMLGDLEAYRDRLAALSELPATKRSSVRRSASSNVASTREALRQWVRRARGIEGRRARAVA